MEHPINNLVTDTMVKIREMMDANTVIGTPIEAGGVTVVPVCKISIGYGSGGTDFAQKQQKQGNPNAFGGAAAMGVNIIPVSFLIINDGLVRVISVEQPPESTVDKVIDMVPGVVDKVENFVRQKQEEKAAKNAEAASEEG